MIRSGQTIHESGPVAAPVRDFIAVDDSGDFSYHPSEGDLLAAFEYAAEASCILDRRGIAYRLMLNPDRRLVLGRALGPVEYHWLKQAWLSAQTVHAHEHRIRRFPAESMGELIADLFEVVALDQGIASADQRWALQVHGSASHPADLKEINRQLAHHRALDRTLVQDPFGHVYRAARHGGHRLLPAAPGDILYLEIHGSLTPGPDRSDGTTATGRERLSGR